MLKLRTVFFAAVISVLVLSLIAVAQDTSAERGGIGMRGAAPGARGAAPGGRGMMGMFGGRGGGVTSPEILSDNRVTFRVSAPQATSVSVRGGFGGSGEMSKDQQGVWSVTVGPLEPEMYGYTLNVDGLNILDPSNSEIIRDGSRNQNLLIVPGEGSDLYTIKDVPHGTISKVWYYSKTFNMQRRMYVYTPPGYESGDEQYPVFYLLHGGGGDEEAWTILGRVPQILDNLIAQDKAKPMLVVMPNGNANQPAAPGQGPTVEAQGNRGGGAPMGGGGYSEESLSVMAEEFVESIGAFIDDNYRILSGSENRAIAGLSMGGGQGFFTGMANLDYYAWVGQFSTSMFGGLNAETVYDLDTAVSGVFKDADDVNEKLELLYMSCGRDDQRITAQKNITEELRNRGIEVVYTDWPGGHEWKVWRYCLVDIAKRLFQ